MARFENKRIVNIGNITLNEIKSNSMESAGSRLNKINNSYRPNYINNIEITKESSFFQDLYQITSLNLIEGVTYSGTVLNNGIKSVGSSITSAVGSTISTTATQLNNYTADIYDLGNHGRGDLTASSGQFILGQSAMIAQNAYRLSKIPASYALNSVDALMYRDNMINRNRMRMAKEKADTIKENNSITKLTYTQILSGRNRKDILNKKDKISLRRWNIEMNDAGLLDRRGKLKYIHLKSKANKYNRMLQRSNSLQNISKNMKRSQFSIRRSSLKMLNNQSRKAMNMLVNGNDPSSTTNRAMWASQKSARIGFKTAKELYKKRMLIQKYLMHPIRTLRFMITSIISIIASIISMITTLPIIASIIAVLAPLIVVIICILSIITTILGWFEMKSYTNEELVANKNYAANAFIYEAKQRNWKNEAIEGVLAYMLSENLTELGTFTYTDYFSIKGAGEKTKDLTLNNKKWLHWLDNEGKIAVHETRFNIPYAESYSEVAVGILSEKDIWKTKNKKTTKKATNLINYADSERKAWQDPKTQLDYYFKNVFNQPTVFDEKGVDPTKDNRSAEEWCRRFSAGYGRPELEWTVENAYMENKLTKIKEAKSYVKKYKAFAYIELMGANLAASPNFNDTELWVEKNPYKCKGQCTWFAWGRFYEIYGFSGGFLGNGYQCVSELLRAHPDKFEFALKPKAGALGSSDKEHNHVWIVTEVKGDLITIQEGNLGAENGGNPAVMCDSFEYSKKDWRTITYTLDQLKSKYGNIVFANPR